VTDRGLRPRNATTRRLAELATTARNASRLAAGARLVDGQALESLPADVEECLRDARSRFGIPPVWSVRNRLTTVADVAVIELSADEQLAGVLKLARTPAGDASLGLQLETLQSLGSDPRLGACHGTLPDVLAHGVVGERRYSIERAVPGTVGTALPEATDTTAGTRNAVLAIAELHRGAGAAATPGAAVVDGWLEPALSLVADLPTLLGPARRRRLLEQLRDRIHAGTDGRSIWLGRTHGDYFPGNVFFGPSAEVTGIIDWGQSRDGDPAVIDLMTYLLVVRADRQGTGLAAVVREVCRGNALSAEESALVELHRSRCPADRLDAQVMALLAWVRHVENNLLKSPRYGADPAWVYLCVERVLKAAAG
jgi:Ser/Thr protein kinase RdoA (MazF antagonist)